MTDITHKIVAAERQSWSVVEGYRCWHVVSADGQFSTGCISFNGNGLANAHLIAAAPDMYELIRGALQYFDEVLGPCDDDCECFRHSARAVLAKAEGR